MRLIASLAAFALAGSAAFAVEPSFDCDKAKTADEIAICDSNILSELDSIAAFAYGEVQDTSGKEEARSVAREAMAARRKCGSDSDCIMGVQVDLLRRFQELGADIEIPDYATASAEAGGRDDLPTEVGKCVTTAIARITSRFVEDINENPDDGSAVEFENGGGQVSYDKVQAIINSTVGDKVIMCLVSIPEDCPPGDDRGRIYTTTNMMTNESWTLPDSQHSCGGA